jgi:hypothetical protein
VRPLVVTKEPLMMTPYWGDVRVFYSDDSNYADSLTWKEKEKEKEK